MNQMQIISEQLVNDYSMMLLNWAYKKLCDKDKAEELVQSVWLEVYRALKTNESRGFSIEKPENFIWKIAHRVWCYYLRKHAQGQIYVSIDDVVLADETDFVQEMASLLHQEKTKGGYGIYANHKFCVSSPDAPHGHQ